jgi:hypothetical protein
MFARLDAADAQAEQAMFDQMVDLKVRLVLAERERANAVQPRRKDMTPAEKSAYIRAKGKAAYDQLPWS